MDNTFERAVFDTLTCANSTGYAEENTKRVTAKLIAVYQKMIDKEYDVDRAEEMGMIGFGQACYATKKR